MTIETIATAMIQPQIQKNDNIITMQKDKKVEKVDKPTNNMKKEKHSSYIDEEI